MWGLKVAAKARFSSVPCSGKTGSEEREDLLILSIKLADKPHQPDSVDTSEQRELREFIAEAFWLKGRWGWEL